MIAVDGFLGNLIQVRRVHVIATFSFLITTTPPFLSPSSLLEKTRRVVAVPRTFLRGQMACTRCEHASIDFGRPRLANAGEK